MQKVFKVFAQNLNYYNEGSLVGGWIELPQSPKKIDEYLKEVVKVDGEHEEYEIADVDEMPFPYSSIQWSDLHKLNDLAIVYSTLTEERKDAVHAHLEIDGEEHYAIEELINVCMQADDIEYYPYNFEGLEYNQKCSENLKLGYTMAEETGLYYELQKMNALEYFDFEKYGESYTFGLYETFKKGYLIIEYSVILDYYSSEQIKEKVSEILRNEELTQDIENDIDKDM